MPKYGVPLALDDKCSQEEYTHWLYGKAAAHVKRDKKRGNITATTKLYRDAIHKAVCEGGDRDAYTGRPLRWDLICTYDNDESKAQKRKYKKQFADLPTVDHEDDGMGEPRFKICAWRTNDCKNDLTVEEFIELCEQFIAFQRKHKKRQKRA